MIYHKTTIQILLVIKSFLFLAFAVLPENTFAQVTDPTVVITSAGSTLQQTVSVMVSDGTTGAAIHYTTDGTAPTTASATVSNNGTLLLSQNATLKVQAFSSTSNPSNIITAKTALNGMVSSGDDHTLALKNDGTVRAWGNNLYGQLGNGDSSGSPQSSPVQVMTGASVPLTGIIAVAAGTEESFAVDNAGNVWAWGLNSNSQLGIGGTSNAVYATQITGLTGIVAIASSHSHTLVLKNDGSVWTWGANTSGQVGNGATSAWVTMPTQVLAPTGQSGNLANIVAVAAGTNHSLALTNGGAVYAWGSDSAGQLGDADTNLTSQSLPVQVQRNGTTFTNIVAVAAGALDSFALRNDGTAWSWGDNTVGELGNGTTSPALPVNPTNLSAGQIIGLTGTIVAISNQSAFGNATAWTWGDNTYGEIGAGVAGGYATLALPVNFYDGTPATVADFAGNNQAVNSGAFSNALTVTVTNGGNPVQNTTVYFIVTQGSGLLATSTSSTQFSNILQAITNAQGQASIYFQEPAGSSGSSQITATSDNGQSLFSIMSGGTGVPALLPWVHGETVWRQHP